MMYSRPPSTVLFVADVIELDASNAPLEDRPDMEMTHPRTVSEVMNALRDAGFSPVHVPTLAELDARLKEDLNVVVLSHYSGACSRSRVTFVPARCESVGVPCAGLDAWGHAMLHDKKIAKDYASGSGLLVPRGRVIRENTPLELLDDMAVPYIVKPLAEGSSIGVSQRSVVRDPADGPDVVAHVMRTVEGPVLVEEFIEGREVTYGLIENGDRLIAGFNEQQVIGDPDYYVTRVWDAQDKFDPLRPRRVVPIDAELDPRDEAALQRFVRDLGRCDYMRIDGRFRDGRFYFLEANPNAYLGARGQLAAACAARGISYPDMFRIIIESAHARFLRRVATG